MSEHTHSEQSDNQRLQTAISRLERIANAISRLRWADSVSKAEWDYVAGLAHTEDLRDRRS